MNTHKVEVSQGTETLDTGVHVAQDSPPCQHAEGPLGKHAYINRECCSTGMHTHYLHFYGDKTIAGVWKTPSLSFEKVHSTKN